MELNKLQAVMWIYDESVQWRNYASLGLSELNDYGDRLFDPRSETMMTQGAVSIRKTVLPGVAIPMLKIRRPNGRLIFNIGIAIPI